jgi:hypothetical protein
VVLLNESTTWSTCSPSQKHVIEDPEQRTQTRPDVNAPKFVTIGDDADPATTFCSCSTPLFKPSRHWLPLSLARNRSHAAVMFISK